MKWEEFKPKLIYIAIGLLGLGIGYFYHSFYWKCIGSIICFFVFIDVLWGLIKKENQNTVDENIGCLALAVIVLFSIIAFFNNDDRYISPHGSKQHLYEDCSSLSRSSDVREVSELEGYFHLSFTDCKTCLNRKKAERKAKRDRRKELEREEKIQELQEKIEALRNGADVEDIEDYDDEDYDEPPAGVPSRYW